MTILQSELKLGKPWAYNFLGTTLAKDGIHNEALTWYVRAAMKGNFDALALSEAYREGKGVPQDLKLSEAFARKARALNPDCALSSNYILLRTAVGYIDVEDTENANAILRGIAKEIDENAIDDDLCGRLAAHLWNAEQYNPSAEMYARSFCCGHIESAHSASYMFSCGERHALSKLWFDVARHSKSLYNFVEIFTSGEKRTWKDIRPQRDAMRSKLRELRNSCGGCRATLAGERRKFCRCCLTYCYCNKECQKQHWENGHREECKEVEENMRKIQTAIRAGKFDSTLEKE